MGCGQIWRVLSPRGSSAHLCFRLYKTLSALSSYLICQGSCKEGRRSTLDTLKRGTVGQDLQVHPRSQPYNTPDGQCLCPANMAHVDGPPPGPLAPRPPGPQDLWPPDPKPPGPQAPRPPGPLATRPLALPLQRVSRTWSLSPVLGLNMPFSERFPA